MTDENKQITDIVPQNEDNTLPEAPSREDKFIRNLFIYRSKYKAAIEAGYSENTAKSTIYTKLKNERFRNKIRDYAITNDLLSLPKIAYIEEQILDHLVKNPLDTPKFVRTLKEKKQIAGVLGHEIPKPQQPTINIKNLRVFMESLAPDHAKPTPIPDAEVIDTDTQ